MPRKNLKQTLDLYSDQREKNNRNEQIATVVSVAAGIARVRIRGSNQTQDAIVTAGMDIQYNDEVRLTRTQSNSRVRWIVDAVTSVRATGLRGIQSQYLEIFPPSGVTVTAGLPGAIMVRWNAPVTSAVSFEFQTADDSTGTNATTELITRGSYAIIVSDILRYFRIRSIAFDGQFSAWTDWTAAPSGASSGGFIPSGAEPVTYCGVPIWWEGYPLYYTPPS